MLQQRAVVVTIVEVVVEKWRMVVAADLVAVQMIVRPWERTQMDCCR